MLLLSRTSPIRFKGLITISARQSMSSTVCTDEAYKAKSASELIEIVDADNKVLTPTTRADMRTNRLIHRATYAFIRTPGNYFYVQKRSMLKDYCPGFFDPNPGGVVGAGESYEVTNMREIEEEMGISRVDMSHLFTFFYEDNRVRCWGDAWECEYEGPIKMQKEEVDDVLLMSMEEILARADSGENFTPDSVHACRKYVSERGLMPVIGPRPEVVFS